MKVITVGRSQECNIVVNDVNASRVHLQLVQDDNGNVSVVDLGSTNGTWVNEKRIAGEMRLNQGDRVRVGNTILQWQNYFATHSGRVSTANAGVSQVPQTPKPKRTLMWIITAAIAVLFLAGGAVWIFHEQHVKKTEREEAKELQEQVKEAKMEATEAKVRSAHNVALRNAAEIEKENALAAEQKAIKARKEEEQAKIRAIEDGAESEKIANITQAAAQVQVDSAISARNEAEVRATKAEADRKEAIKKAAEDSAKAETSEQKAELTKIFYENLNKAYKDDKLKEMCDSLKIDTKKYKKDEARYDEIVSKFNSAKDNQERKTIIDIITKVLSGNNKASKKTAGAPASKDNTQGEKK